MGQNAITKCQNANACMLHGHMGRNVVYGAMAIIVSGNTWCNNSVITKIAVPVLSMLCLSRLCCACPVYAVPVLFVLCLCCACRACRVCAVPVVSVLCRACPVCVVHVLSLLLPALSTLACPVYVVV